MYRRELGRRAVGFSALSALAWERLEVCFRRVGGAGNHPRDLVRPGFCSAWFDAERWSGATTGRGSASGTWKGRSIREAVAGCQRSLCWSAFELKSKGGFGARSGSTLTWLVFTTCPSTRLTLPGCGANGNRRPPPRALERGGTGRGPNGSNDRCGQRIHVASSPPDAG